MMLFAFQILYFVCDWKVIMDWVLLIQEGWKTKGLCCYFRWCSRAFENPSMFKEFPKCIIIPPSFRNTDLYLVSSWKISESSIGITFFLAFFSTIFLDKVCAKDRLPSMEWNVIAPGFMAHVGFNLPETGIAPLIALQGPQIQSKENEDGYIALLLLSLQRRSNAKLYIYFSFLTFIAAHER